MTSKFTCINCRVAFVDAEIQRQHYKTDWHRYNLKRKVVELPPVTAEEFQRRVILQREQDEAVGKDKSVHCNVCHKTFSSSKSFENHLKSKKHLALVGTLPEGSGYLIEIASPSTGSTKPKSNSVSSQTISKSSISEADSELEGADSELERADSELEESDLELEEVDSDEWDEEISEDNPILRNDCLFCSHHSAAMMKNLKHMSTAHSFFVPDIEYVVDLKGLLCYLGEKITHGYMCLWCNNHGKAFYSKEAAQQHMIDKGHCKMLHEGETLLEYSDYYDYSSSYPDNDSKDKGLDDEVLTPVLEAEDYQLVLPSGSSIGHRSLMRYYRQSFDPKRIVVPAQKKVHRVIAQYRALGWTEGDKQAISKKARDLRFMQRVQAKYSMKLGVKANNLSIKRPQVNF